MSTATDPKSETAHLIVVCGHGTYRGSGDVWSETSWILEPFRKSNPTTGKPSEHFTFLQHILCGAAILDQDPTALLVFSGGCTQSEIAATEAESYQQAFIQLRDVEASGRTSCEVLATDSHQNLLFSVLQFAKVVGTYPRMITVITHAFKERRFLECHASAIRWPVEHFRTIGINPAFTYQELKDVQHGEYENAFKQFVQDLYGTKTPLADKRIKRGWDQTRLINYLTNVEPVVRALVLWEGGPSGNQVFPDPLPWS